MKSQYSDNGGYYVWDANKPLAGKLREGYVKKFIDDELGKGKRPLLKDYKSLFNWVMNHKDSEHLLNDSLYICEKINGKIKSCSHISNHKLEYTENRIRLSTINLRATAVMNFELENKSVLESQINSAILLDDYYQLAEILERAKSLKYLFGFVKSQYMQNNLPANAKKLMFMDERIREHEIKPIKPSRLEKIVSKPLFLDAQAIKTEPSGREISSAYSEFEKDKSEQSAAELIFASTS